MLHNYCFLLRREICRQHKRSMTSQTPGIPDSVGTDAQYLGQELLIYSLDVSDSQVDGCTMQKGRSRPELKKGRTKYECTE